MYRWIGCFLVVFFIAGCSQSPKTALKNQASSFGSLVAQIGETPETHCTSEEETTIKKYTSSSGYTASIESICRTLREVRPTSLSGRTVSLQTIQYPFKGMESQALVEYAFSGQLLRVRWVRTETSGKWYQLGPGYRWVIKEIQPRNLVSTRPKEGMDE